jgi:hypothetical protein
MRISDAELIVAQRDKVDALEKAARASGDSELLRYCTLALEEGSSTFDTMIWWVGGRVSEGNHRTRVHVPAAEQYVVLYRDRSKRWVAGEVGASLPNDSPAKYDVMLALGESSLPAEDREPLWMRGPNGLPRVFYFHAEEVAPFTEQMVSAASGLWTVLIDGKPAAGNLLFAGGSEQDAIATWRRHTKSRTPRSRLSAIPRAPAGQGPTKERQSPVRVVLVASAERAIRITRAVKSRLQEGDRVPNEDFYTSSLFRRSLAYARTLVADEHIRLLSARYGLNQLWGWKTRPTSDDVPLDHMSLDELKDWAWRINHELVDTYGARPRVFVVLAGFRYVQALRAAQPEGVQWTFDEGKAS